MLSEKDCNHRIRNEEKAGDQSPGYGLKENKEGVLMILYFVTSILVQLLAAEVMGLVMVKG